MIDNDDLLHRVDKHYLGPTGAKLPVRLRYASLGLGALTFVIVFIIARAIVHVPLGFKSLVIMLVITVAVTTRVTKMVSADRPVRSVFKAAWNDLTAPRPPKRGTTVVLHVPSIPRSSDRAATSAEGGFPR